MSNADNEKMTRKEAKQASTKQAAYDREAVWAKMVKRSTGQRSPPHLASEPLLSILTPNNLSVVFL